MCGIAGIISSQPAARIGAMLRAIEHRGRDDEGVWTSSANDGAEDDAAGRRACLGHRRLSIIDTSSAGHQPMLSADGRFIVVFNGEIYNYKELRAQLISKEHAFQTDSDTEVLLAAWTEWGENCLPKLNGMFAFALWDEREKTLVLVRDRVGIKPLYYTQTTDENGVPTFLFASEIKALLASGIVPRALDFEGLNQFLTFLWTPDPHTLFQNVFTVPPAHILIFKDGDIALREWWDIAFDDIEEGKSEAWWRDEILATLDRVVGLEMTADVPVGAFLSGGIDSSVIVALMHKYGAGRATATFTAGIAAEDLRYDIIPDDVVWARKVGALLNTDYRELTLQPDITELLPKIIYQQDTPGNDMAIPSYLIAQAAREKLTVMLSGIGGDEVFAGYPRQLAMRLAGALDFIPGGVRQPLMRAVAEALPGGMPGRLTAPLRNAKKFARSAGLDFAGRYLGFGTYFTDEMKAELYAPDVRAATRGLDAYRHHRRYFARVKNAAPLNRLLYVDLKTFLPCHNLHTTDKTAMAANLEVRVPFLNVELMELAARMPPALKLKGLERKYILKRAAERVLPREIVWRKKAGFGAPLRSWLRGALKPMVADLLSETNIRRRGLFDPQAVRAIVEANLSGREDYNLQVFQLLTLELWQQTFLD